MKRIRLSKLAPEQLQQLEDLLNGVARKAQNARKAQARYVASGAHARLVAADDARGKAWDGLREAYCEGNDLDHTSDVELRVEALRNMHEAEQTEAAAVREQDAARKANWRASRQLERSLQPLLTASGELFAFACELGDVGPLIEDASGRPVVMLYETDTICLQRVIAAAAHQARRANEGPCISPHDPWQIASAEDQQASMDEVATVLQGGRLNPDDEGVIAETIRAVAAELGLEVK
jgi:hypothetical protein